MTEINITPFTPVDYPGNWHIGMFEKYVGSKIYLQGIPSTPVVWTLSDPYSEPPPPAPPAPPSPPSPSPPSPRTTTGAYTRILGYNFFAIS